MSLRDQENDELFTLSTNERQSMASMRNGGGPLERGSEAPRAGPSPLHDEPGDGGGQGGVSHYRDQDLDPNLQDAAREHADRERRRQSQWQARQGGRPPRQPGPDDAEEEEEGGLEGDEAVDAAARRRPGTVPHAAMHQERVRRQQAEERAREAEAKYNLAAARLQAYFDAQQQFTQQQRIPVQPVQQPPSWRQNPIQAGEDMGRRLAQLEAARAEEQRQRQQEYEEQRQAQYQEQVWNGIYSEAMQDWQSYKQEQPDALPAYQYLLQSREQELLASRLTPQQVEQQLAFEESNAVLRARQTGMRLGDYVMAMAQARGWRPGMAQGNGNGIPDAAEQVHRTARGQAASRSLSNGRGTPTAGARMTLDRLMSMSDGDFARFKDRNPNTFRELLGG